MYKKVKIATFVVCILIGVGFACQMKISDGNLLYISPQTIEDYKTNIESEKKEIEKLRLLIEENDAKLDVYKAAAEQDKEAGELLEKQMKTDLENFMIASGAMKVKGAGVEIVIDDGTRELFLGEDINNLLVHDSDINMIINELKRCGAEAISVNGQRITPYSAISCSGYTVRINGEVYARPFKIKAIGDGKRMAATLIGAGGYGASLKEWGIQFEVRTKDDIVIDAVGKEKYFIYMDKVQGGN